jgi:hypothetical protein
MFDLLERGLALEETPGDVGHVTPPKVPGTRNERIAAIVACLLVALGDELVRQLVGNPSLRPF